MNLEKLQHAEESFFTWYPGGFKHPEMVTMAKKHKMDKMTLFTQESFSKENFKAPETIIENMAKIISRSSMVSMFEKPKFKKFVKSLALQDKELLAIGLEKRLYGKEQEGFEILLDILRHEKLAKWSLITICPTYFRPQIDVFVKPTTVKGVIEFFELKSLRYKPAPSWAFYEEYRAIINDMKTKVDPSLAPDNAAFSGFLMMSLESR
ncbi:MAG: hypothetical protein GY801_42550 [bacterium]|nr:hypothetical protein [bacterium]